MKKFFPRPAFFSNIRAKTIFLSIVLCLVLLTPTALALSSVYMEKPPANDLLFSVTLYNEKRVEITSATCSEDPLLGNNLADILYRMIKNGTKINASDIYSGNGTPVYVLTNENGVLSEYTCYFSFLNDDGYYVDSTGQHYAIAPQSASEFLSSPYAESLYNRSTPPALYTNAETQIIPTSVSWHYRVKDQTYQTVSDPQTTSDIALYEFNGALSLSFAENPDFCLVQAVDTQSGIMIYESSLQGLSKLIVDPNAVLRISIRASWTQTENAVCYGELSYNFNAVVRNRSTFSINQSKLYPNDFLLISCHNISDPSKLSLQCDQSDLTIAPSYHVYADTVLCIIPYPTFSNAASPDTLNFSITYGATTQSFSVSLLADTEPHLEPYLIQKDTQILRDLMDTTTQENLQKVLVSQKSKTSKIYFRGNIISLEKLGFSTSYVFGQTLKIPDTEHELTAFGTAYATETYGTSIPVLMSGEVVAVGESPLLGRYVAVNHGLNITTWYCHLSDYDVRVGDIVAKGESIGKSGNALLANESGVMIAVTVNGQLCDPKYLIEKEILF